MKLYIHNIFDIKCDKYKSAKFLIYIIILKEKEIKMSLPPQQFCVRWNSYHTNLQTVFPKLLSTENFVDVTLACENRQIKCHKVVLSACSTYFERLLIQNPCKHPIIFMKDMR